MTVQVTGLRETVRDLERAGIALADLKTAFSEISQAAATEIRPAVPVRSGRLLATLKPTKAKNYAAVSLGSKKKAPYAAQVAYGKNSPHRGFLQRATKPLEAVVYDMIRDSLNKLAEEASHA